MKLLEELVWMPSEKLPLKQTSDIHSICILEIPFYTYTKVAACLIRGSGIGDTVADSKTYLQCQVAMV